MDPKNVFYVSLGIFILFFLLDYFLIMNPFQIAPLQKLGPQIKTLSEDIKTAQGDISKLKEYEKEADRQQSLLEEARMSLRSKEEVPILLQNISVLADDNGVQIDQIMPDSPSQETLVENKDRIYYQLPIQIEAQSGFHNFGRFLNQLENENTFMKLDAFSVLWDNEAATNRMKLTLNAIIYEDKVSGDKK
jgi:Tfp pilus assembly protein PilO